MKCQTEVMSRMTSMSLVAISRFDFEKAQLQ